MEGKELMAESHRGTLGAAGIAEMDVKVTHESHCPVHLAMWLHFFGVTLLEVLNNSQCSSIQPSYLHFNLKGTGIKMTWAPWWAKIRLCSHRRSIIPQHFGECSDKRSILQSLVNIKSYKGALCSTDHAYNFTGFVDCTCLQMCLWSWLTVHCDGSGCNLFQAVCSLLLYAMGLCRL